MSTYDKIYKDPFYRTLMAAVYGRWQKLADSGAFETAFGAAGAFLAGEKKRNPNAKETPFSLASSRNAAKYIMDKPGFKRLTADPSKVDKLLAEGAKDPDKLFNEAVRVNRPFYNIGRDKTREILSNLKKMQPLMDGADAYDSKWAALQESISSIDLRSNDPALSGELKLQEILNKTTDFMKGKKSSVRRLRGHPQHQSRQDRAPEGGAGSVPEGSRRPEGRRRQKAG